jgi:hypothetical protein
MNKIVASGAVGSGHYAFVLVHNHPSGGPAPSEVDIRLTRRLAEGVRILQINMLDHEPPKKNSNRSWAFTIFHTLTPPWSWSQGLSSMTCGRSSYQSASSSYGGETCSPQIANVEELLASQDRERLFSPTNSDLLSLIACDERDR